MRGIKYALAFLFGAIFASMWWGFGILFSLYGLQGNRNPATLVLGFAVAAIIILVLISIIWLFNHWDDNN